MEGPKGTDRNNRGVILRAAEQIFAAIEQMKKDNTSAEISVTGSYLEIYQEHLRDLLDGENNKDLRIRMDPLSTTGRELYVEGLSEVIISNEADFEQILASGTSRRTVGETNMNEISSRSHAVLTLLLKQKIMTQSTNGSEAAALTTSKIHLIDLAGILMHQLTQ